jgi:predicted metalloprotease with PDZ domain
MRKNSIAIAAAALPLFLALHMPASGAPPTWIGTDAFSMGAFLVDIKPGGPAEAAGLKAGDFIYRFDNKAVSSMAGLFDLVHATPAGKIVEVYFLRGAQVMHVNLKVEALPGSGELEGMQPDSVPLFDDPTKCTPAFRALAGRC